MRLKATFSAALSIALIAYAFDCAPVASAQQAMQCCRSLRCPTNHQHRGMSCCRTMPSLRAALGQPSGLEGSLVAPAVLGFIDQPDGSAFLPFSFVPTASNAHAPPGSFSPPLLSLRI